MSVRVVLRFCRQGLPVVVLALGACQALNESAPVLNGWSTVPSKSAGTASGNVSADGAPAASEGARTTYIEGTGNVLGAPPSHSDREPGSGGDITLKLVNVPTSQAAKTILGDILSLDYTVDPSVEGKITIQTPKPVPKATVMTLFEAALRGSNAALTYSGGIYKIVPADQALAGARITIGTAAPPKPALGSSLRIVPLKYVSAVEMKQLLDPISPHGGGIQTDPARNTITLSGSPQEIADMLDAISVFDVDVMKGMSFAIVPVETSAPVTIADELKHVFASEAEGPMAGMVRFLPNKRLGAILVISPQRQYLARAEEWIRRLDAQAAGSEKQFYTYKVQNRQARDLVDVIRSMFSSEPNTQSSERNVTPEAREATISTRSSFQQQKGLSVREPIGARTPATVDSDKADERPSAAQISFGGDQEAAPFRIVADPAKNAILIEATPKEYRRVLRFIKTLDVIPNQVMIDATIAEVSLTDQLRFGLRWYFKEHGSSFTFSDSESGAVASVFPGFSYALALSNVEAALNALNDITDVNIVSSPSLTVMDNKTALLQIGDEVPITTQTAVSVENPNAPIVNSVSYRDTGVILSITPRINESGRVLLDIEQEVSSVAETTTSGINSPTIRQRRVKTTVMVNDGEAIALGGLIQKSQTKGHSQVPIFGDIPIIGTAFKHKDDQIGKTELIILIRPHVMRNLEETRQITEEFKNEFVTQVLDQRDKSKAVEKAVRRTFD